MGEDHVIDMDTILPIDDTNLNQELVDQPGKYARVSFIHALAKKVSDHKDRMVKQVYAERYIHYKKNLPKRPTEALVNHTVQTDKKYIKAAKSAVEWRAITRLLLRACMTLEQRKDLLLALNVNLRKEWDGSA